MAFETGELVSNLGNLPWREIDTDTLEEINTLELQLTKITDADTHLFEDGELLVELPELLSGSWIHSTMEEKRCILSFTLSNCTLKDGKALPVLKDIFRQLKETKELIKNRK